MSSTRVLSDLWYGNTSPHERSIQPNSKNMTKDAFFAWAEEAAALRDELLPKYNATGSEERSAMAESYCQAINKL